jgi:hypothetical protein
LEHQHGIEIQRKETVLMADSADLLIARMAPQNLIVHKAEIMPKKNHLKVNIRPVLHMLECMHLNSSPPEKKTRLRATHEATGCVN